MRFHYHGLRGIWENLNDLSLPRTTFSSEMADVPAVRQFITEDEIDAALTAGSGVEGGKGRIYGFFQEHREEKERIRFLRDEYGTGGALTPCPAHGAAMKITTGRACGTARRAARMCILHGIKLPGGLPV